MDIKNAYKFYASQHRVNKLRRLGAKVGKNVIISKGCKFDNPNGLIIGDNVYIGDNFYSNCVGGLSIGNGTLISYNCTIMTYNHDYNEPLFMPYGLSNVNRPVEIREHVWIGINVSINSGVTIGNNAIVGMGTTVPKSIPDNSIYAGTRIIKEREEKNYKYSLLEVRRPYNPWHLSKFNKVMEKILLENAKNIKFSIIKSNYLYDDYLNMIYTWCEKNIEYRANWEKEKIELRIVKE